MTRLCTSHKTPEAPVGHGHGAGRRGKTPHEGPEGEAPGCAGKANGGGIHAGRDKCKSELMGVTSMEAEKAINDGGIFFDNLKFCDIDYYCEKGRANSKLISIK